MTDEARREALSRKYDIELQGAVNRAGEPFVIVRVDGKPYGQLTPAEALHHGIRSIQASIESERDAAIVRGGKALARKAGDTEEDAERYAAGLLMLTREHRGQVDPDPRQDVPEA